MKIKPCISKQMNEETVAIINTEKYIENKVAEKVALPTVGAVHIKSLTSDGSTCWANSHDCLKARRQKIQKSS